MDPSRESKQVLIVEDDYFVASNLKTVVETLGYGILGITNSGDSAIEIIEKSSLIPGLVLMDIALKGEIDGIETARRIQDRCDSQILYITGNRDHGTVQRAVETTTPLALLSKPLNIDKLKSLITGALDPDKPMNDAPRTAESRASRRLTVPSDDSVTVTIKSDAKEFAGTLKDLSMTGANLMAEDIIMGMGKVIVKVLPHRGLKEITSEAQVIHMTMANNKYHYGVEFEPDKEAKSAIAEYYSFLTRE